MCKKLLLVTVVLLPLLCVAFQYCWAVDQPQASGRVVSYPNDAPLPVVKGANSSLIAVTLYAYDREGYYITSWIDYYPYGYNTISVPSSLYVCWSGWEGVVGFWKWGDGVESTSRHVYICGPTSHTVYYRTPITTLKKEYVGEVGYAGLPTDFVATGYVKSVHGKQVAGVGIKGVFCLTDGSVREDTATSTSFQSYYGWFILDVYDPWATWWNGIKRVELDVVSVPDGYQDEAGVQCWLP